MQCQHRNRPTDQFSCTTLAQDGSKYCPRHTFLHNVKQQDRQEREIANAEAKRLGVHGVLPRSRAALLRDSYVYLGNDTCTGCGKPIEWWKTPKLRHAPFDPMPHEEARAVSHFATCTKAARFKRAS